jgi:UDP-N-acetylglucosamine 1-carboxyvinyltransferase
MHKFKIKGGQKLQGEVVINGSKNASLPIMAASILTAEDVILHNVPELMDIRTMIALLEQLGKKVEYFENNSLKIVEANNEDYEAPYDIVRKMRASIAVMGPLLGRRGKAKISFPGGCAIGPRPIDIHLKGMKALGTEMVVEHGYVWAQAKELTGKRMNILGSHGPSVLATENVMMAAVLAKGKTVIDGAAAEPEVSALADFLVSIGAKITGAGTSLIEIEGVSSLHGSEFSVIPDRIETGTFIACAGITGGRITVKNTNIHHVEAVIEKFSQAGVEFDILSDNEFIAKGGDIKAVEMDTQPYPFFPTDLQAQLMAHCCLANGISIIRENIFPDRFMHAPELVRMGADIQVEGNIAVVKGVPKLSGAAIMASDIRAGAGLVVGALAASGLSEVLRIYHIDRGYENFELKLQNLGADIERVPQDG